MVMFSEKNHYYGLINAGKKRYTFDLTLTRYKQNIKCSLKVDWRLQRDFGDSLMRFLKINSDFSDPWDFYRRFNDYINSHLETSKNIKVWFQHPLKISVIVKSLIQEINEVHEYIKDLDLETRIVTIEVTDPQLRSHQAVIMIGLNYKNEPIRVINHDLPQQKSVLQCNPNLHNTFSLSEFCNIFSKHVADLQPFWNTVAMLDSLCCVLDPLKPLFKDVFRRIKLSNTVSVMLTFNPFYPAQRPNIRLLGCQTDVNFYQTVLQNNLENDVWDINKDLLYNLSNVLETSIPNKIFTNEPETPDLNETRECAICFTCQSDDETLSETCENPVCKAIYHSTCLFTYLSSIPRNRDYFGKIQGECPNCNDIISCNVPKLIF